MNTPSPDELSYEPPAKVELALERDGMVVTPADGPWRFFVTSQTGDPELVYLVDLQSFWGAGQCTCKDFEMRHQPFLVRGDKSGSDRLRCKHIRLVRSLLMDHLLRARPDY